MTDQKTISIAGGALAVDDGPPTESLALVIAWCADDARRVGEVAPFPDRGGPSTLGRGAGDGEPRLRFFRQGPGRLHPVTAPGSSASRSLPSVMGARSPSCSSPWRRSPSAAR